ncbi:hypothetical protein C9J85_04630 [Haloferax sp. wsp5]|nr:hypothetical protein C9J85_04630 [Haloferax sp. wsp5]
MEVGDRSMRSRISKRRDPNRDGRTARELILSVGCRCFSRWLPECRQSIREQWTAVILNGRGWTSRPLRQ